MPSGWYTRRSRQRRSMDTVVSFVSDAAPIVSFLFASELTDDFTIRYRKRSIRACIQHPRRCSSAAALWLYEHLDVFIVRHVECRSTWDISYSFGLCPFNQSFWMFSYAMDSLIYRMYSDWIIIFFFELRPTLLKNIETCGSLSSFNRISTDKGWYYKNLSTM